MTSARACGFALIGLAAGCTALNPSYGEGDGGGTGTGTGSVSASVGSVATATVSGTTSVGGTSSTTDGPDGTASSNGNTTSGQGDGSTTGTPVCPQQFTSDFDGDQAWVDALDYWTPASGAMVAPSCGPVLSFVRYEDGVWDDASVVMDFSIDDTCPSPEDPLRGVGMLVRMNAVDGCNGLDAIFCLADHASNRLVLGMANGACNGDENPSAEVHPKSPLELGVRYQMRVEVFGNEVACALAAPDGTVAKVALADASLVGSPGTVAFYSENAAARVESLTVCPG